MNKYLLALARTGRGEWKPEGILALVLVLAVNGCRGAALSFDLERYFNFIVMDNDSIDHSQNQFARFRAPDTISDVGCQIISPLLSAQLLDD